MKRCLFYSVVINRFEEQQRRATEEEEKKELKTWMRKKQQERLVQYRKQREEKRERERNPFTHPVSAVGDGFSSAFTTIQKFIYSHALNHVILSLL